MVTKLPRRTRGHKSMRASVSFPENLYAEVESIADRQKVSVAWVVRDAVEKYVAERYPLFGVVDKETER